LGQDTDLGEPGFVASLFLDDLQEDLIEDVEMAKALFDYPALVVAVHL
jgi:hypothetical protein